MVQNPKQTPIFVDPLQKDANRIKKIVNDGLNPSRSSEDAGVNAGIHIHSELHETKIQGQFGAWERGPYREALHSIVGLSPISLAYELKALQVLVDKGFIHLSESIEGTVGGDFADADIPATTKKLHLAIREPLDEAAFKIAVGDARRMALQEIAKQKAAVPVLAKYLGLDNTQVKESHHSVMIELPTARDYNQLHNEVYRLTLTGDELSRRLLPKLKDLEKAGAIVLEPYHYSNKAIFAYVTDLAKLESFCSTAVADRARLVGQTTQSGFLAK